MYQYEVSINTLFKVKASSPAVLREKLIRMFRDNGFEGVDFEIGIELVKKGERNGNTNQGSGKAKPTS